MRLSSARDAKFELLQELEQGYTVAVGPLDSERDWESGEEPGRPPNVAVGISPRPGRQFAVAVRAQTAATDSPGAQIVAGWVDRYGDDLDIRVIGEVRKQQQTPWYRGRVRPLRPGASVAHVDVTAGTIGTFVRRPAAGGEVELLSNNHVLADENQAEVGDEILQPGPHDGGSTPDDVIGRLTAYEPVNPSGTNLVDCAVSSIETDIGWSLVTFDDDGGLTGLLDLSGPGDDGEGEGDGEGLPAVAKYGRTTGRTAGTITAIELDNLQVRYDVGVVRFDDQIEIQGASGPFSQGGDSGSLVIALDAEAGARALGLLFAGSETGGPSGGGLTYVNPIVAVLGALDAELVLGEDG